jgi:hypothetical protein
MATTNKPRPCVGDTAWFVEWCEKLVFYEDSEDVDCDACPQKTRRFATREEAAAFAKEVWPKTVNVFGVVSYWPAEFVAYDEDDAILYPHAGFWEDTGDSEYYEGEEA